MELYTAQGQRMAGVPWQVYPRPQMKRENWVNLNGQWEFTVSGNPGLPEHYGETILVPFCPESLLSGVHEHFPEDSYLFYRRNFHLSQLFEDRRVLLHFGAVDQCAQVFVNNQMAGGHVGGYEAFTIDITRYLKAGENTLTVQVTDDLRSKVLPYGKQTMNRGGMWYTPVSGIWQTVWLEWVPCTYIQKMDIQADMEKVTIGVTPKMDGKVLLQGKIYPLKNGVAEITVENPQLWSPENPYLYYFAVETECDRVESYFAMRSLTVQKIGGYQRLCLNGKPYFFHGLLDQGYWSDGLYTPADERGFERDILAMKKLGFNTLRKHIKVEPEQFYYDCDRWGMVVFQDMVNNGEYRFFRDTVMPTAGVQKRRDDRLNRDAETRKAFECGMVATVNQLKNHPCICYWTIFNEGWGQFEADRMYEKLLSLDDSRFIDATSGWFRRKKSDVESLHIYFGAWGKLKAGKRPLVLSEFGGYGYGVQGHLYDPQKAFGYKACKSKQALNRDVQKLYLQKVLPAVEQGLCASIYTQVSDVEDEINGLLTYDRKICKAEEGTLCAIAKKLQTAVQRGKESKI